jgi:hypothetical protein
LEVGTEVVSKNLPFSTYSISITLHYPSGLFTYLLHAYARHDAAVRTPKFYSASQQASYIHRFMLIFIAAPPSTEYINIGATSNEFCYGTP